MPDLSAKRELLLAELAKLPSCAVAFSGGVDSAVVAKAAFLAIKDRAVAVIGIGASLATGELELARDVAGQIGIRLIEMPTDEINQAAYRQNGADRCFHCKTELYSQMGRQLSIWNVAVIVNGANLDDLGDYRPGMQAASQHQVHSPLAAVGLTKAEVRQLAKDWNLPVWDKPATPCLSSRVAYGEEVTPERLRMIDGAEQYLRAQGFTTVRVRYHRGDIARLEVPLAELARFCAEPFRGELIKTLRGCGFKFVTLDLEGFRSGSMNEMLGLVELKVISG